MIKNKPKKCAGLGIAKGYGCGVPTLHRQNGLGKMCGCYSDWLLNSENGKIKMQKSIIKAKSIIKSNEKAKENEFKKKLKSKTTNWKNELQNEINKITRLIDAGLPCLARNYVPKQMHAGHVYARGGNNTIRYNLHNIHRQSAQSNRFQNDDGLLREGVAKEYGQDYLNFISELRQTPQLTLKQIEYEQLTRKAQKIVLKLKKEGKPYSLEERIKLRNEINLELGIYELKYCVYGKR